MWPPAREAEALTSESKRGLYEKGPASEGLDPPKAGMIGCAISKASIEDVVLVRMTPSQLYSSSNSTARSSGLAFSTFPAPVMSKALLYFSRLFFGVTYRGLLFSLSIRSEHIRTT